MIDTNSPDYLAGVTAGRRSFRLVLTAQSDGCTHSLVNSEIAGLLVLAAPGLGTAFSTIEFGHFRLTILDTMPHAETYPDQDSQELFSAA